MTEAKRHIGVIIPNELKVGRLMKFSIVTSTFNVAGELASTERSLAMQLHRDLEWIVVDGASTDGTVDLIRSFGDAVTVLISERDSGIYDAWNKAVEHIQGDWVIFLGAGDTLYDEEVLKLADAAICGLGEDITTAYGKVLVVDKIGADEGRIRDEKWVGFRSAWSYRASAVPSHQAVFHKSTLFKEGFRFDDRFRICADMELMLREFLAGRSEPLDFFVTKFVSGGVSQQRRNRLKKAYENALVYKKLGLLRRTIVYHVVTLTVSLILHPLRRLMDWMR